jgi:hypothetical protein
VEYLRPYLHDAGFAPSVALVVIFYALLRGVRDTMWRVALLSLPGTIAHELTHLVVGFLVHAKPHGFSIWPRRSGNGWILGSVSFRNIGLLNGAFVAFAPLLLLPIAWLCLIHVLMPLWIEGPIRMVAARRLFGRYRAFRGVTLAAGHQARRLVASALCRDKRAVVVGLCTRPLMHASRSSNLR